MSATAIDRLFHPRSVAVVGASSDASKLTGRPVLYLQKHGFSGRIFPVNPRYGEIAGLPCFADVTALPEAPDVALVLLAAERVEDAVAELAAAGTGTAIVLASGFGEAGAEGERRQRALKAAAGSMRVLGPNTIGLLNLTDRIVLSASGALELDELVTGNIGLVSQSGGILGSLLSRAARRGIGFSKLVATGNEVDLDVADFVSHLIDDEATAVIALYLETLRHPERFRAVCARAAEIGKPIVAFKVGRSEAGQRSAVSHTGALAGADRMYDALFRQCGVVRAQAFEDLLNIPVALAPRRRLAGRRVAVVTSTGGAATLIADSCGLAGFETPPPDPSTAARLVALDIRDAVLDRNPIDVTLAGLKPELLRAVIGALFESPTYDAVIVIVGSSGIGRPGLVAEAVLGLLDRSGKPLVVYVSPEAPNIVDHLNREGVPAFSTPESCATALAALVQVSTPRAHAAAAPMRTAAAADIGELRDGPLNEAESKRLFARFGIPSVREIEARTAEDAARAAATLSGPVVLKALSRRLAHKTEAGGVKVGVAPADVAAFCSAMAARVTAHTGADIEGFLVQEMVAGVEMILGFHRDPQLGPAVLLGMGGVMAELFDDTALRLLPIRRDDAVEMIMELKGAVLLAGYRGRPHADMDALVEAILAFAGMIDALGERLVEAEINPLFVRAHGNGVRAADGIVVLGPASGV